MALSRSPPARCASARSIRISTTLPSRPLLSAAVRSRSSSASCLVDLVLGDQQPGEREVVAFGEVGQVVAGGDAVLAGPGTGAIQAPAGDVDPGPERRDRAYIGEEAGQVERLRLLEEVGRGVEVAVGLPEPGHGGVPAVPVLKKGTGSPTSRAAWRCSAAACRSPCSRSTSARPTCRSPVTGSAAAGCRRAEASARSWRRRGLGGAAAGQPHLRQDDGGAELVGQVPGRVQAAHRSGERLDRSVEVAAAHGARPRNPAPAPRARWSSGPARCRTRRACCAVPAMSPRAWATAARYIAIAMGSCRSLVVGGPRLGRRRRQGSLGGAQPSVRVVHVAIAEPAPRGDDVEDRAAAYDVVRQPSDPAPEGPVLPLPAGLGQGALDEVRRVLGVVAGDRMCDRVIGAAVFGVPPSRCAVQTLHTVGLLAGEPSPQRVGEEVVVAVPPPLLIEGNNEQVGALEDPEHVVSVVPAGQRVAQQAGQLAEDRRVEQEGAHLWRLAVQDLLDEIVEDEAMASGERLDDLADVAAVAQ